MQWIANKRMFLLNQDTFKDYENLQEIRFKDDIRNHRIYTQNYIFDLVKNYKYQTTLTKFKSIGHRNLMFSFSSRKSMSIPQAAIIHKVDHLMSLKKHVNGCEYTIVNENGGFCEYTMDSDDIIEEYNYLSELMYDNDTMNLVIENDGVLDNTLLKLIDSNIEPSYILHYKDIARIPTVNEFLKSRTDWVIWVYTQGMDLDLYRNFLTIYKDNIESVMVKTSSEVFEQIKDEFNDIDIIRIGANNELK